MTPTPIEGLATIASRHSVDDTVDQLAALIRAKGATLFAVIDHSGEAAKAGMTLPPTRLLIFGSPVAGTPLMQAAPSVAIDLPLKLLVWADGDGQTWISYNTPAFLRARHRIPADLAGALAVVETLAAAAAG